MTGTSRSSGIVGEGLHAASWIEFTVQEGTQPGLCLFELEDDGRITKITDFWQRLAP
jgi:hypothetical protein